MKYKGFLTAGAIILSVQSNLVQAGSLADCLTNDYDRSFFNELKAQKFQSLKGTPDDKLAVILSNCLGHSDPELRDGIAYEGLTALLRAGRVSNDGKRILLSKFSHILSGDQVDNKGFLKPFTALGLAEIARTDRVEAYLTKEQRQQLVETATAYLASVKDYRGFDEKQGWRHGVAHGADLLMQLTLNKNIDLAAQHKILDAIATQIAPKGIFYKYGEAERLARPLLFIARRGSLTEQEWTAWLTKILSPTPILSKWSEAYSSQAGLAKRQNTYAFLSELYLNVTLTKNKNIKKMLPGIMSSLRLIP